MRLGCNLRVPSLLVKSDDCELARAASDSFEITMTLMPSHGPASGRRFHLAPNPRMVPPSHHLYTPRRAAGWVRSPKFGPRGSALCVFTQCAHLLAGCQGADPGQDGPRCGALLSTQPQWPRRCWQGPGWPQWPAPGGSGLPLWLALKLAVSLAGQGRASESTARAPTLRCESGTTTSPRARLAR